MLNLMLGDCLERLAEIPDSSVDLIATDPPYFKVKGDAWDRQWDKPEAFLAWMGELSAEWSRVLKPNGSLYVFASPQMASRVEVKLAERFEILNHIVWQKPGENINRRHVAQIVDKGLARSWLPANERIIFAEHFGADSAAKGESGYGAKCDELRGFVFEPLRAYLAGERDRAGWVNADINAAWCKLKGVTSTSQTQKWFSNSCFNPPTAEAYAWLRSLFGEGYLRREYEDLRTEYEDLRRPFEVTADVPYTDVWDFTTVNAYPGKHPCEKPLALMEHIIRSSSRPGAVVLDCFLGSGSTGVACVNLGRRFIGIEKDEGYFEAARRRIEDAGPPPLLAAALPSPQPAAERAFSLPFAAE